MQRRRPPTVPSPPGGSCWASWRPRGRHAGAIRKFLPRLNAAVWMRPIASVALGMWKGRFQKGRARPGNSWEGAEAMQPWSTAERWPNAVPVRRTSETDERALRSSRGCTRRWPRQGKEALAKAWCGAAAACGRLTRPRREAGHEIGNADHLIHLTHIIISHIISAFPYLVACPQRGPADL